MSQAQTEHLSIRIPTKMKNILAQEAESKQITISELIKEKILIASAQNCTLSLNFDGVQIPIERLTKGVVTLEKTV